MRERRQRGGGVVAAVFALALCSCASESSGEPDLDTDAIPAVTNSRDLTLPLDAYMYTDDGYRNFLAATTQLESECLGRFGVDRPDLPIPDGAIPNFDHQHEGRYGRLNLESAEVRGYRIPPEFAIEESETDRVPAWVPTDEERFLAVGIADDEFADRTLPVDSDGRRLPEDGCRGEAERLLTDGLPDPNLGLPEGLANQAHHRAEHDSRVHDAMAQWSECMDGRGYSYETIWDARNHPWPDPVGDAEIAAAVADMECMVETNLVGIWHAVETAYQEIAIEEHAEELAEVSQWLDTLYRNSALVLSQE